MTKNEMTAKDEDDIPKLSLRLCHQLGVDQSIFQNINVETPTEKNTWKWEIDPMSSFVEPIAKEADEQFVMIRQMLMFLAVTFLSNKYLMWLFSFKILRLTKMRIISNSL